MYTLIVANAPDLDAQPFEALLQSADLVIAADGGCDALARVGIAPHVLIGDLDSLAPASLEWAAAHGADVQRHTPEKDETDLELALLLAAGRGAQRIDVLGALGGRWDHSLANVALLALPDLVGRAVRLVGAGQQAFLVREHAQIEGRAGDIVSLLPLTGAAHGVTTRGLRYPLHEATLRYERSRGVSNVLDQPPGAVSVRDGLLLVVQMAGG
ncbi:MAG: thiamine diphosphokinase [Chloroflexales bacterium]|nr:thiamine diphosphokinase [Chloroflexales bacterium]